MRILSQVYNDVEDRNKFITDFKIPILYEPIDYSSLPVTVINRSHNWSLISEIYEREKIVVVDNFLEPEFTDTLRKYTLISNIREDIYVDYSAINFSREHGHLWFKLLSNIVDESIDSIPLLKGFTFERAWSFIYSNISEGINIHSDPAKITLNLWVTPDDCMDGDLESNGLEIWKVSRPSDWTPNLYTGAGANALSLINANDSKSIIIPYKNNRLAIFDSSFFHRSQPVRCKSGYQNKRINYTFLYS